MPISAHVTNDQFEQFYSSKTDYRSGYIMQRLDAIPTYFNKRSNRSQRAAQIIKFLSNTGIKGNNK